MSPASWGGSPFMTSLEDHLDLQTESETCGTPLVTASKLARI